MNLFTDLRNALLALPAVTAIVGSGASAKIWNSWPRTYEVSCIVMDIDSEEENNCIDGKGGLITASVTVTCRAATHDASDALQEAVRHGLAGYSGTFEAVLDSTVHSETPKADGSTEHWYDHVMDFSMLWLEAV